MKIHSNSFQTSVYEQGLFLAVFATLFPGFGHVMTRRYLAGAFWLLVTCSCYEIFIPLGLALHILCVIHVLSFGGRWRVQTEAIDSGRVDLKEIRRNRSHKSVYLRGVLLGVASGVLPGLGHILSKRYRAGVVLPVATCVCYKLSIVSGVTFHLATILYIMFLVFLESERLDASVGMREPLCIVMSEIPESNPTSHRARASIDSWRRRKHFFLKHITQVDLFLGIAHLLLPGLGHFLVGRYLLCGIIFLGVISGYAIFSWAGLALHIVSAIHLSYLSLLAKERRDSIVDLAGLLGIEIPLGRRSWLDAMNLEELAALQSQLKTHAPVHVGSSLEVTSTEVSKNTASTSTSVLSNDLAYQCRNRRVATTAVSLASALVVATTASIFWRYSGNIVTNRATALFEQGKYAEAEPLLRQALAIRQKRLDHQHPEVAEGLNNLAAVLDREGKYAEAESLYRQALAIKQQRLRSGDPDLIGGINNLAVALDHQGKYVEAELFFRRALAMSQKWLGPEHPVVATGLNNLAHIRSRQGKYAEAEPLYRQALAMQQKLLGPEHPDIALGLNNLALVLSWQGKYAEAEPLSRQALAMWEKVRGTEHPDIAQSLNDLAGMLAKQGLYAEAERILLWTLNMRQKLLGPEHPEVAETLDDLASVIDRPDRRAQTELIYRHVLKMRQKVLGSEHPQVARSLGHLASVLSKQGKYTEAEPLYHQALAISQKVLGPEHPGVAAVLNDLAMTLSHQGRYAEAEPISRQALAMCQQSLGGDEPIVASYLNNRALILLAQGQIQAAISPLQDAARIREKQLRSLASEARMLALLDSVRGEEDAVYGLLLDAKVRPALQRLAMTMALLRKGRAAEAGARANFLLHRSRVDPDIQRKFADWQAVRQQHEAMFYGGMAGLTPDVYRERLWTLGVEAQSLEARLAFSLPQLRSLQPPAFDSIVSAVAQSLPPNSVLIEVVYTKPLQYQATDETSRWGEPHFVALLLFSDQRIASVDLGLAVEVDNLSQALLVALRNPGSQPKAAAMALYRRVFGPLLPHLNGKNELFLSLDGALNVIPFAALHDGTDYLLGRYRLHYLTSGRDLLRKPESDQHQNPLVLADPDFQAVLSMPPHKPTATAPISPPEYPSLYQQLKGLPRLPGTRSEAAALQSLLRVSPLLGSEATEEAVHRAQAPLILHIASHGVLLADNSSSSPAMLASRSMLRKSVLMGQAESSLQQQIDASSLSRSILLLAGTEHAETASDRAHDGILNAEEVRSLNLWGTQLVVLSACDTGTGAVTAGQGVYGLRRAFLVAGAETLVTSLWPVADKDTSELMITYYRNLVEGKKPRVAAMEEAMQVMKRKRPHPYYWAPFIVIGQDGPLRGLPSN